MGSTVHQNDLPDSNSPDLHLSYPTPGEYVKIWTNTSASWRDSLNHEDYLQESLFLTTVPLARDGRMTTWILVDKNLPQDHRRILCSCESFLKRSLRSDADGDVEDVVVHGIASVFCPPEYRRRGYAARFMTEVAKTLCIWHSDQAKVVGSVLYSDIGKTYYASIWHSDQAKVVGSVLYSDIGKTYYAKLGWQPNHTNWHVDFPPIKVPKSLLTQELVEDDLAELCKRDEAIIRASMARLADGVNKHITILPDLDHMLWHIEKEKFATERLFGKIPRAKGAIAGPSGNQVWAIWTHRYYGHPNAKSPGNVLYILRLVVEGDDSANKPPPSTRDKHLQTTLPDKQTSSLIAVLQHAQAEAAEWRLDQVKLWEPSPWVQHVITESKINHCVVEREEDSIASGMWYDGKGGLGTPPVWINNEHYAWC